MSNLRMLGVRLPDDLIRRLRAHAALQGLSAAAVVQKLLEAALPAVSERRRKAV